MIEIESVLNDVRRAVASWNARHVRRLGASCDLVAVAEKAAGTVAGAGMTDGVSRGICEQLTARFCIATKGPRLDNPTSLACVSARLMAFGATVHALHRIDGRGEHVARSLYPTSDLHFHEGPASPAIWALLARRFDTKDFTAVFGRRYDPSLVVSGAALMQRNHLRPEQLTDIWEDGRVPVRRDALQRRYGHQAARFILGSGGETESYAWFRGPLPLGISRIATGVTAFAMRDERVDDGAPVIVVNGHVPGLAALFQPTTWVFDVGLTSDGAQIDEVRRYLAGDDSRPSHCQPGSLRRDAADGHVPLGDGAALSSRHNLVHCSDGFVAGMAELRRLLPDEPRGTDLLTSRLCGAGLSDAEVFQIVLADPRLVVDVSGGNLSDRTSGMRFEACMAEVLRAVPPVFGAANGEADGVTINLLGRALKHASRSPDPMPVPAGTVVGRPPRTTAFELDDMHEAPGITAIANGGLGVLVPAGGTGGRFGGYHVPESDSARHKALRPEFSLSGRSVSSLDIRLANVRFWDDGVPERVPVGVMGSATSESALNYWRDTLDEPYRKSVQVFIQHGVYRADLALVANNPRRSWLDIILRDASGRPSLKPSGGLGLVSAAILSGLLDSWEDRGVAYLAVANGDDVGFRLDPRIVGYLVRNPGVDCVVTGIPWRYTTSIDGEGGPRCAWGDESGWSMDDTGAPLGTPALTDQRTYDVGSALHLVDGNRLEVRQSAPRSALFNTNQLYLRVSAIRRAMARTGTDDPLTAIRRITAGQPIAFEDKTVQLDNAPRRARQISQPLHSLLPWFDRCDVVAIARQVTAGMRGSYAPLKDPADVRFAALMLATLQRTRDELVVT